MKKYLLLVAFLLISSTVVAGQVTFKRTNEGRLYSDQLHLAIFDAENNIWNVGPIVSSFELEKGSYVWLPDQDYFPNFGKFGKFPTTSTTMRVVQIEYYNVTEHRSNCCIGVEVGFPIECQVNPCCGACCC